MGYAVGMGLATLLVWLLDALLKAGLDTVLEGNDNSLWFWAIGSVAMIGAAVSTMQWRVLRVFRRHAGPRLLTIVLAIPVSGTLAAICGVVIGLALAILSQGIVFESMLISVIVYSVLGVAFGVVYGMVSGFVVLSGVRMFRP